jgi:hypothetical protein
MTSRPEDLAPSFAGCDGRFMRSAIVVLAVVCSGCAGELAVTTPSPVADAGFDQRRFLGAGPGEIDVEVDGRGSCDPAGGTSALAATWTLVAAPAGPPPNVDVRGLVGAFHVATPGSYTLALTVRAGDRESEADFVTLHVEEGDGSDDVVGPPLTNACGEALE